MGVVAKLRELRWRAAGHYTRRLPEPFLAPLRGARLLEVGGPSGVFGAGGLLPAYEVAAVVDGVQWAEKTTWHDLRSTPYATGTLHLVEGATLAGLPDGAYDGVISSHVVEHLADPLGALEAWRRVCRSGGALVLVAPHMAGTFDHRRAVTPLAHMVADHARRTGEDDLTHLEETLRLHDRARDVEGDQAEWERLRRDNVRHRLLHHHVFTTTSLAELLTHAGVVIEALETRYPHDVYVVGRFGSAPGSVDQALLERACRASPFAVDRRSRRRRQRGRGWRGPPGVEGQTAGIGQAS